MPGYIIHLAEATLALRHLKRQKEAFFVDFPITPAWEEDFLYGALLPDSVEKSEKRISHFWNEADLGKVLIGPDLNKFKEKYAVELSDIYKNPVLYGYYHHLYTDWDFFTNYFPSVVELLDSKLQKTNQRAEVATVRIVKNNALISLKELFSKQYLYGDYTILNKRLIDRYHLVIPGYQENFSADIPEIHSGNMKKVINDLKFFIAESESANGQLHVFEDGAIENYLESLEFEGY